MNGILYALALVGGIAIGLFYFGGLWLTVRRLAQSRHPVVWAAGSFVGRLAVTAVGLVLLAGGDWIRLLLALAGFLAGREVLIRRAGGRRLFRKFAAGEEVRHGH